MDYNSSCWQLRNAYRARKGDADKDAEDAYKVPQSFTFMRREG